MLDEDQGLNADDFDTIVLGTGLAESIIAASLAKSSEKVLHIDPFPTYGGPRHSSLTIPELVTHLSNLENASYEYPQPEHSVATSQVTFRKEVENGSRGRQYAISLYPGLLPARGKLIDTLISSGVSGYVGFRIVDGVGLLERPVAPSNDEVQEVNGSIKKVPSSKGQVFKDKTMSLLEKRKLMKMLMFVANLDETKAEDDPLIKGKTEKHFVLFLQEAFDLPLPMARDIAFGIAQCSTGAEPALVTLLRMQRYLRSLSRYSPTSSFLVAQFGGIGEIVQGFCRSCAVYGGTYILGEMAEIRSGKATEDGVELQIKAQEDALRGKRIIGTDKALRQAGLLGGSTPGGEASRRSHCVAIISSLPHTVKSAFSLKQAESQEDNANDDEVPGDDVLYLIVPPTGDQEGEEVSRVLFMGSGTGSCPEGEYVMYISSPRRPGEDGSAKTLLDRLLVSSSPSSLSTAPGETEQTRPVAANLLFVACYDADSPYDLADRSAESTGRLISLDDTVRTKLRAKWTASCGSEWVEGMDFEADLAQSVLDGLGVEMINKREEGEDEGEEDGTGF